MSGFQDYEALSKSLKQSTELAQDLLKDQQGGGSVFDITTDRGDKFGVSVIRGDDGSVKSIHIDKNHLYTN